MKKSVRKTLPVMAGYVVLGTAYGLLINGIGHGFLGILSSIFIFAGSAQFLQVTLTAAGAGLAQVAILTFLLNFRHFFYGLSMIQRYHGTGMKKWYLIFALTDETYAILSAGDVPEGVKPEAYYLTVSALDQLYWVTGTVIGVTVGSLIKFDTTGADFAMTALFVVLAVEQWKSSDKHAPALFGLCCGAASLLIVGPDYFLIPALVAVCILLMIFRRMLEEKKPETEAEV